MASLSETPNLDLYNFDSYTSNNKFDITSPNLNQKITVHKWGSFSYAPLKSENFKFDSVSDIHNSPNNLSINSNKFFNSTQSKPNSIPKAKRKEKFKSKPSFRYDPFSFDDEINASPKKINKNSSLSLKTKNSSQKVPPLTSKISNLNTPPKIKTNNTLSTAFRTNKHKLNFTRSKESVTTTQKSLQAKLLSSKKHINQPKVKINYRQRKLKSAESVSVAAVPFKARSKRFSISNSKKGLADNTPIRFLRNKSFPINYSDVIRRNSKVEIKLRNHPPRNFFKGNSIRPNRPFKKIKKYMLQTSLISTSVRDKSDILSASKSSEVEALSSDDITSTPIDNSIHKRPPQLLHLSPPKNFKKSSIDGGVKLLRFNPCENHSSSSSFPEKDKSALKSSDFVSPQDINLSDKNTPYNPQKVIGGTKKEGKSLLSKKDFTPKTISPSHNRTTRANVQLNSNLSTEKNFTVDPDSLVPIISPSPTNKKPRMSGGAYRNSRKSNTDSQLSSLSKLQQLSTALPPPVDLDEDELKCIFLGQDQDHVMVKDRQRHKMKLDNLPLSSDNNSPTIDRTLKKREEDQDQNIHCQIDSSSTEQRLSSGESNLAELTTPSPSPVIGISETAGCGTGNNKEQTTSNDLTKSFSHDSTTTTDDSTAAARQLRRSTRTSTKQITSSTTYSSRSSTNTPAIKSNISETIGLDIPKKNDLKTSAKNNSRRYFKKKSLTESSIFNNGSSTSTFIVVNHLSPTDIHNAATKKSSTSNNVATITSPKPLFNRTGQERKSVTKSPVKRRNLSPSLVKLTTADSDSQPKKSEKVQQTTPTKKSRTQVKPIVSPGTAVIKNLSYYAIEPNPTLKFKRFNSSSAAAGTSKKALPAIISKSHQQQMITVGSPPSSENYASSIEDELELGNDADSEEESAITDHYTALLKPPPSIPKQPDNENVVSQPKGTSPSSNVTITAPTTSESVTLLIAQSAKDDLPHKLPVDLPTKPKERKIFISSKERRTIAVPKKDFDFVGELNEDDLPNEGNHDGISRTINFSQSLKSTNTSSNYNNRQNHQKPTYMEMEKQLVSSTIPKSKSYDTISSQGSVSESTPINWNDENSPQPPSSSNVNLPNNNNNHQVKYVKDVKQAYQCHECGEVQDFNDDVEYLVAGLRASNTSTVPGKSTAANTTAMRCLSIMSLATKCQASAFRTQLRAQGLFVPVFSAVKDATQDPNLELSALALIFTLTLDKKMHSDILNDLHVLELLLDVLHKKPPKRSATAAADDDLGEGPSTKSIIKTKALLTDTFKDLNATYKNNIGGSSNNSCNITNQPAENKCVAQSNFLALSSHQSQNSYFEQRVPELAQLFTHDPEHLSQAYNLSLETIINLFCYQKCNSVFRNVFLRKKGLDALAQSVINENLCLNKFSTNDSNQLEIDKGTIIKCKKLTHLVTTIENIIFMDHDTQRHLLEFQDSRFLKVLLGIIADCIPLFIVVQPTIDRRGDDQIAQKFPFTFLVEEEGSTSSTCEESVKSFLEILLTLFFSILKLFLNVTHENDYGAGHIVQTSLEITRSEYKSGSSNKSLLLQRDNVNFKIFSDLLVLILAIVPERMTERSFDMVVLVLCFLINLMEYQESNKTLLLEQRMLHLDESYTLDCLEKLLQRFFVYLDLASLAESDQELFKESSTKDENVCDNQNKNSSLGPSKANESGVEEVISNVSSINRLPSSPQKTVPQDIIKDKFNPNSRQKQQEQAQNLLTHILDKAGEHMEYSLVGSYIALFYGCLIQNNLDNRHLIVEMTKKSNPRFDPIHPFEPMINILNKFIKFVEYSTACGVSTMKTDSVTKIIKSFKNNI